MENEEWPEITVNKLEAASRQFETAISLWFEDGDEVSTHMLTASAHQVCHTIAKQSGKKSPLIFNDGLSTPDDFKAWKKYVLRVENFFKHAETDASSTLTFRPVLTTYYLWDGIWLFHELGGTLTLKMIAFLARFQIIFPESFTKLDHLQSPFSIKLRSMSKPDFLKEALEQLALAGS